jgi:hypothetical protein
VKTAEFTTLVPVPDGADEGPYLARGRGQLREYARGFGGDIVSGVRVKRIREGVYFASPGEPYSLTERGEYLLLMRVDVRR